MGLVLTLPELRERLRELKAAGKKIAFANGHFDLIHVGHLRYLRSARAEADALVVAINDDDSVERLKGPGRPVVPAAERAELLAGLEPVDFVVVFQGDSPAPLLAELQPDVHCKGTDYGSPERVPEYETVRAYGGRTALVGDPKDHATSDLIARVKALPDPHSPNPLSPVPSPLPHRERGGFLLVFLPPLPVREGGGDGRGGPGR
jgi:rfaE bifunctional protein nucleotidyltransferase chain/domain